jgi:hypothetical protein
VTRWTLRVLGFPVLSLDLVQLEYVDQDEPTTDIGGGSAHNFTMATPYVDERYLPWDEDKAAFGFGGAL